MEILFENQSRKPEVSIVLLDWSVRESFHMLDYLAEQNVPRDRYEVIWIEYYERHAGAIRERIDGATVDGKPSPVDVWCVMDMPRNIHYHKHLMYNLALVMSRGDVVCFCDSDAVVKPTFIESIVRSFDEDGNIALHLDELRSINRRFYPFNYASIDEIERSAVNFVQGKTTGLIDKVDPLHTLNYGACMCAKRGDLIAIGGADEHMDYLGHVCGPYEMTFRLVNYGRREVWHQSEWLIHTWHPGQAGGSDYAGPHDGINISSTALDARKNGRILPLKENPAVRKLREGVEVSDLTEALGGVDTDSWAIRTGKDRSAALRRVWLSRNPLYGPSGKIPPHIGLLASLRIYLILLRMLLKQTHKEIKRAMDERNAAPSTDEASGGPVSGEKPVHVNPLKSVYIRLQNLRDNVSRFWAHDRFMSGECREALDKLRGEGVSGVSLYGTGDVASMLRVLARGAGVRINGVSDDAGALARNGGKVIVASFVGIGALGEKLRVSGVKEEDIAYLI